MQRCCYYVLNFKEASALFRAMDGGKLATKQLALHYSQKLNFA
jgi:hypothetical protein